VAKTGDQGRAGAHPCNHDLGRERDALDRQFWAVRLLGDNGANPGANPGANQVHLLLTSEDLLNKDDRTRTAPSGSTHANVRLPGVSLV
jgi:hypothetical protein